MKTIDEMKEWLRQNCSVALMDWCDFAKLFNYYFDGRLHYVYMGKKRIAWLWHDGQHWTRNDDLAVTLCGRFADKLEELEAACKGDNRLRPRCYIHARQLQELRDTTTGYKPTLKMVSFGGCSLEYALFVLNRHAFTPERDGTLFIARCYRKSFAA